MKKNIAVAGNIGSGKSRLIDFLCTSYPLVPLRNISDENPYLADFYKEMSHWSFHSQIFTLAKKFQHFQKLSTTFHSVIQHRTIYEDAEIFARNLYQSGYMNETDFRTYYDLYLSLSSVFPAPDLLIYLHSSVGASRKRLKTRSAPFENFITNTYLKHLNRLYVNWIADYDLSEVIIIDTEQLDFASNLVDRADILEAIERFI
ncbi:MAG: deoxynucleoside kinase [Deltaproteobacteria bacterium]|nr:deoxynucleoside kinase [Deltaproteobacteria bacterium]